MSLLKSLLSTAAVVLASGMAMAFPSYTISPASGKSFESAQSLANFNVSISSDSYSIADGAEAILESLETGDQYYSTAFRDFLGAVIINFDYTEIVDNGEYELTIPAGSIISEGEPCPKITATYTLNDPTLGSIGNFPKITLVSSDPADGSDIAAFGKDFINRIDFKTSDDAAVNYIDWFLYDVTASETTPEYIRQGSENRIDVNRRGNTDDAWTEGLYITLGGSPERLIKGHKYRMDLTFAGIGYDPVTNQYPTPQQIEKSTELKTSIYFNGLTEPTEYSPYVFESISPDPSAYEIDNANMARFTITYSGPVKPVEFVYSQGFGDNGNAGTYAALGEVDADGCASKWEFTFYESLVAETTGTIISTVKAQDKDGLYVKGNGGYPLNDFEYTVSWLCNVGAPDLVSVSPENGATVETLSEIVVGNNTPDNLPMALSYNAAEKARITDMFGSEIRVLDEPVAVGTNQMKWTFEPITESGSYVLVIPAYYFTIGEEYSSSSSKLTTFNYVVENGGTTSGVVYDIKPASVEPVDGSTVESLTSVKLTFKEMTLCDMEKGAVAKVYKVNGDGNAIAEATSMGNDFFNPTIYTFKFPTAITEEGKYYVQIDRGQFFDEAYDASVGGEGHANDVLTYGYTVGSSTPSGATYDIVPASVEPAEGSTLESLASVKLTFAEMTLCDFEDGVVAKVYKEGDDANAIAEATSKGNDFFNPTIYTFKFPTAITEAGNYYVKIERGQFFDEAYDASVGEEGHANETLVYNYTIESALVPPVYDIVPASVTPADGAEVEELSEVVLTFADATYYPMSGNVPEGVLYKVEDSAETEVARATATFNLAAHTVYTFTFTEPVTEKGTYRFKVEKGAFCDQEYDEQNGETGHASDEIIYTFKVSGQDAIAAIFAAEGEVNVYTVNGMVVLLNATIDDFNMLPEGIYLVNGRKVYKK